MLYTAVLLFSTLVAAASDPTQPPKEDAVLGQLTSQGCFSSLPQDAVGSESTFASSGVCSNICEKKKSPVTILLLDKCYCADTYPSRSSLVADDKCDYACPGYAMEACGGDDTYSVYNTGLKLNVKYDDGNTDKSTSGTSASASSSASDSASASTSSSSSPTTTSVSSGDSTSLSSAESATSDVSPTTPTSETSTSTASSSSSTATSGASRRFSSPIGSFIGIIQAIRYR